MAILTRDLFTCQCGCNEVFPASFLEVDHIIPREFGGDDSPSNLRTMSKRCHAERHGKYWPSQRELAERQRFRDYIQMLKHI